MSVQNGDVVILQIGGVQLGALVSNSQNMTADMLDKTNKDDPGIKQFDAGEDGWGLSVEALWDPAAGEGFSEALGYLKAGTEITVLHGVSGTETFTGTGLISSIDVSGPKNEISSYSLEIQGTGEFSSQIQLTVEFVATQFDFKFKLPSTKSVTLHWGDGSSDEVVGQDAVLITETSSYSGAATYTFSVTGDVTELTWIQINSQAFVSGDISKWSILTNLISIQIYDTAVSGDVSGWSALTLLTTLSGYRTNISGDISGWSTLTAMTGLQIFDTNVSGDVSGLNTLTSLTVIRIDGTDVTWDTTATWVATSITIQFNDCAWTAQMVDNSLASFAATPVTGCTINIAGDNAARTSGSDSDFAIVDGANTLTVNS